jgi:hypothetical protein
MKWAEVIMVRSAGSSARTLETTLHDLMSLVAVTTEREAIRVFRHEKLDSDICIVLLHEGKQPQTGGSILGLNLAASLEEVGLVNHTIWNEIL